MNINGVAVAIAEDCAVVNLTPGYRGKFPTRAEIASFFAEAHYFVQEMFEGPQLEEALNIAHERDMH